MFKLALIAAVIIGSVYMGCAAFDSATAQVKIAAAERLANI